MNYLIFMIEITDEQATRIIEESRITEDITGSAASVAVVLTQDWCPQWLAMKKWLSSLEGSDLKIYFLCYNRKPYFDRFMQFKETVWNNHSVPYLRYYRDSKLIGESNYTGKKGFMQRFA